jgi:uncharacterized protein (DUF1330 family)
MAGYVIAEVVVHDPALYEEYRKQVPATIAQYGGKYLVRGGATDTREGDWRPQRLVVLEFASVDQARKWHQSPEYAPVAAIRQKAATSKVVIVEGV